MILTCPECATRYQTDAAAFAPPGRKVRCAKCGHVWHQVAPPPEPEATIDLPPRESPRIEPRADLPPIPPRRSSYVPPQDQVVEEEPVARSRTGARLALAFGWLVLIGLVLIIGWSAVVYRQQVAALWPQSASLYAKLGMEVNARGIAFVEKSFKREMEDGQFVLVITGKIANISDHEIPVPKIRATLMSQDKRELTHWSFSASAATLHVGESVPFLTRISNPPNATRHIELRFEGAGG
ncbi:MAG: zinc-ribbon domain-containing protein [Proteobacteria bacterium]|nr:zinc-ribbon domain-containing protein [Pseudomonadota bacterium]